MNHNRHTIFVLSIVGLLAASAAAAVPEQLHYQGVLQNTEGEPIHCPNADACPDGPPDLTFRLYDDAEGGEVIWEESHLDVAITQGHFQVVLGATVPVSVELLQGSTFLGVEVEDAGEMLPRQAVVSTPYALRASGADSLGGLAASEYVTSAVLPELCVTPEDLPALLAELEPGEVPGDGDTLATMSCLPDAIAVWNGAFWHCDDHLQVFAAHSADPNAHHPADSAGLDIVPKSIAIAGGDTQINTGSIDLGPGASDELTASMVTTLTGGGEADALHTHAGLGAGGVCYTAWNTTECAESFQAVVQGTPYISVNAWHANLFSSVGRSIGGLHCVQGELEWGVDKPGSGITTDGFFFAGNLEAGFGFAMRRAPTTCAICCK